ncbi:MAG: hypothetical protein Q9181_006729 [Wetmoreana brouardii]
MLTPSQQIGDVVITLAHKRIWHDLTAATNILLKPVKILYPILPIGKSIIPTVAEVNAAAKESRERESARTIAVERAIVEEGLGDTESVTQGQRMAYWDLHAQLNEMSAIPPSYVEACAQLVLAPEKPMIPGCGNEDVLRFLQVQFLAWAPQILGTSSAGLS